MIVVKVAGFWLRVQSSEFRLLVSGSWFLVQGSGFVVQGSFVGRPQP